jgi:predicted Zn finger-like uncharacterized protein
MIVQCEHCKAKFRIDESRLKPWSKVRCSKCGNVFSISVEKKQPSTESSSQPEKESRDSTVADEGKGFNSESTRIEKEEKQTGPRFSAQSEKQSEDSTPVGGETSSNWEGIDIEKEEEKAPSFDSQDFPRSVEKSVEEKTISQGQESNEIFEETTLPQKEPKFDFEKEKNSIDRFEWREFGIKNEENEPVAEPSVKADVGDSLHLSDETHGLGHALHQDSSTTFTTGSGQAQLNEDHVDIEKKEDSSGFSWENLSINEEPAESLTGFPKPLNAAAKGAKLYDSPKMSEPNQGVEKPAVSIRPSSDKLTVDMEKLVIAKRDTLKASSNPAQTKVRPRTRTSGGNILENASLALLLFFILLIIVGAGLLIMVNLDLISKDKFNGITGFVASRLPSRLTQASKDDVVVSDYSDRWLSTRNGLIYVVSGHVTNKSKYPVSYIRIKSEFKSNGERLFEQVVYAGNTFTDGELRNLPFEEVFMKLNRKNGDINFDNAQKLAGLNYDVQSGESVPFFIVFPSKSRILGLKYKVEVEGFEKVVE